MPIEKSTACEFPPRKFYVDADGATDLVCWDIEESLREYIRSFDSNHKEHSTTFENFNFLAVLEFLVWRNYGTKPADYDKYIAWYNKNEGK